MFIKPSFMVKDFNNLIIPYHLQKRKDSFEGRILKFSISSIISFNLYEILIWKRRIEVLMFFFSLWSCNFKQIRNKSLYMIYCQKNKKNRSFKHIIHYKSDDVYNGNIHVRLICLIQIFKVLLLFLIKMF